MTTDGWIPITNSKKNCELGGHFSEKGINNKRHDELFTQLLKIKY